MPGTTPNRLYPYPVPADPTDIPGDIQRLAEAVDADLCDLTANIPVRPAMRLRGTDAIAASTFDPLNTGEELPFDTIDFNTGIFFTVATGTVVNEGFVWAIKPQQAGFYHVIGTVAIPRPTTGTSRNRIEVQILKNSVPIVRNSNHLQPSASDGIRTGSARTGIHMNGTTDALSLKFSSSVAAGGLDVYTVTERTLTIVRMSPTYP